MLTHAQGAAYATTVQIDAALLAAAAGLIVPVPGLSSPSKRSTTAEPRC